MSRKKETIPGNKNSGGVESEFIDVVSRLGVSMGLNRVVGQIYGLLYLRDAPLSLDEISQSLRISKGGASVNIRELENWGAVKAVWFPGSRKDYYVANTDVISVIYKRARVRLERTISELGENIRRWESGNGVLTPRLKERLGEIRNIREILESAIKAMPAEITGQQALKKLSLAMKLKNLL